MRESVSPVICFDNATSLLYLLFITGEAYTYIFEKYYNRKVDSSVRDQRQEEAVRTLLQKNCSGTVRQGERHPMAFPFAWKIILNAVGHWSSCNPSNLKSLTSTANLTYWAYSIMKVEIEVGQTMARFLKALSNLSSKDLIKRLETERDSERSITAWIDHLSL